MTTDEILTHLSDMHALALTMFGEARGDGRDGSSVEERVAVGCVLRNRLRTPKRFGDSFKAVALRRLQFSCWNAGDPNRPLLLTQAYRLATGQPPMDDLLEETLYLADGIARGVMLDQTGGATHYLTAALYRSPQCPGWAKTTSPLRTIGSQVFFRAA